MEWKEFREWFECHMNQQVKAGELAGRTASLYGRCLNEFELFLNEQQIKMLQVVDESKIDAFKAWRVTRIESQNKADGSSTLVSDIAVLHHVFAFAFEKGFVEKNPVPPDSRVFDSDRRFQPFTADELRAMRDHADCDRLLFLLLRWTGLRCSDAIKLTWFDVDLERKTIECVTKKNHKILILPINPELLCALQAEHQRRNPPGNEPVLLDTNGKSLTERGFRDRIVRLGLRAGVENARSHRFRDTLAIDLLLRGIAPYHVATLLGDVLDTVVRLHLPFVHKLRERARLLVALAWKRKEKSKSEEG
jgi:integrase